MRVDSIEEVMVKGPYVAEPSMNVSEARDYMSECSIRHLPVMSDGRLVGVVSERDLSSEDSDQLICDVMVESPYIAHFEQDIESVVLKMAHNKWGSALIVDSDKNLVGIFTTIDAMYLLYDLLSDKPGKQKFPTTLQELFLAA